MENKNNDFEEQLISLVREKDFLYNTKSKGYKNVLRRNASWEDIAKELQRPVAECRQRWKSLRDRFIKEKRRLESPSGSGAQEGSSCEFYGSLLFLTESVQTRRQTGNFSPCSPENEVVELELVDGELINLTPTPTPSSSSSRKRQQQNSEFDTFLGAIKKTVMEIATASTANSPMVLDIDEEFMLNMARRMRPLDVAAKIRLHTTILEEINKELLANLN